MDTRKKLLVELSEEDLKNLIAEVIAEQNRNNEPVNETEPLEDLLTRKQVAAYFGISLVTLAKWQRLKILPKRIKRGGRVFYLRSAINENLAPTVK